MLLPAPLVEQLDVRGAARRRGHGRGRPPRRAPRGARPIARAPLRRRGASGRGAGSADRRRPRYPEIGERAKRTVTQQQQQQGHGNNSRAAEEEPEPEAGPSRRRRRRRSTSTAGRRGREASRKSAGASRAASAVLAWGGYDKPSEQRRVARRERQHYHAQRVHPRLQVGARAAECRRLRRQPELASAQAGTSRAQGPRGRLPRLEQCRARS